MTSWVVDASVVSATLVPGQLQPGADRIVLSRTATLFAPEILRQEFTNAAWRLERRGVMSGEAVDIALARFEALEIEYVDSSEWPRRALTVARRFRQSRIYDAIYLACAEDLDAELWTCDRRFVTSFANHRPARLKLCPDDVGSDH